MTIKNVSASVRGRLLNISRSTGQWRAFLKRGRLQKTDFAEIIDDLRVFLNPLLTAIANHKSFNKQWKAGGVWDDK